MTNEEKIAKEFIIRKLYEDGYAPYAKLMKEYSVRLTNNNKYVAFMEPSKGRITINRGLDEDQVSVVIRHELMHFYLQHEERLLNKLISESGANPDELDDIMLAKKRAKMKDILYRDSIFNIAGDYEISNRAYTDADKDAVRRLNLNGKILKGLVTEDDYADWTDLTIEQMYDKLREMKNKIKLDPNMVMGRLVNPSVFVGEEGKIYGV